MKMLDSFFQNSYCTNSYLHRFDIKETYPDGVLEVCEICHMRKFFKVTDDGRVDNVSYMSYHLKQGLHPSHPFYPRQQLEDGLISPYQS